MANDLHAAAGAHYPYATQCQPRKGDRMKRFTPSMVVSLVAPAVALSGSAFAASTLIDGHSIKNRSIPAIKLTRSAVASLHGARGPRGYQGIQGQPGLQGPTGPAGPPGANGTFDQSRLQYIDGSQVAVNPGETKSAEADCPTGTSAISGGFFSSITDIGFSETFGHTFHAIAVTNNSSISVNVFATVVCAS
jgi:hypothetical protein